MVDYFCDAGLKVLVVSRRRAKHYKDYTKICKRARVHVLNNVRYGIFSPKCLILIVLDETCSFR